MQDYFFCVALWPERASGKASQNTIDGAKAVIVASASWAMSADGKDSNAIQNVTGKV